MAQNWKWTLILYFGQTSDRKLYENFFPIILTLFRIGGIQTSFDERFCAVGSQTNYFNFFAQKNF